jgi:5-methylcytosine-specific restriction endonuclease McrA
VAAGSRHVPAEVKRAVWLRDLGRCAFVGTDGRRCNERGFVEFHHVRPYAAGGEATVENIQLRCRRHNGYEARVFFAGSRDAGGA